MKYSLPAEIQEAFDTEIAGWNADSTISRIWAKDAAVWTGDDEDKWLGWLGVVSEELANTRKYTELSEDLERAGFSDVLLMGMGGSSLGPEVLALTFGEENFHILDSTVPAEVRTAEEGLDLEKTLFIVASKSGSTLEPNCFKQYFFERLSERVGRENAGKQFIAITDPGSKMEQVAKDDGFRHIFYGNPEIGGRFSALSAFGMTAAASMGISVSGFLGSAHEMVETCKVNNMIENPGALLGTILGVCHKHGRDKLTIITSPELQSVGAWLEQLVAESTGKNGVSIIPIAGEPVLSPGFSRPATTTPSAEAAATPSAEAAATPPKTGGELKKPPEGGIQNYSRDRVFAFLSLEQNSEQKALYKTITEAGHPAVRIEMGTTKDLGQEFYRWEFATAVAGSVLGINPFNQPDVEAAKIEARKLTDEYEQSGKLADETPFATSDGLAFFSSDEYASKLGTADPASILKAHLDQIAEGDYFALLAYIEMNPENESALQEIRGYVLDRYNVATCLGFGPRFLHSTGQAYKGGANNGVFLQITADDAFDIDVPDQKYTFGVVKAAQSRGDFQVLIDRGRRALRVHLGSDVKEGLEKIGALLVW